MDNLLFQLIALLFLIGGAFGVLRGIITVGYAIYILMQSYNTHLHMTTFDKKLAGMGCLALLSGVVYTLIAAVFFFGAGTYLGIFH